MDSSEQSPSILFQHLYDSKYIYAIWILEVSKFYVCLQSGYSWYPSFVVYASSGHSGGGIQVLIIGCNKPRMNTWSIYHNVLVSLLVQAILNPLQGLLNAIAYGGVCYSLCAWVRHKLSDSYQEPRVCSWSGEYIDVDFRVSRGRIHQSKRQVKTPSVPPTEWFHYFMFLYVSQSADTASCCIV